MNNLILLLSNPSINLRLMTLKHFSANKNEIRELESVRINDRFIQDLVNLQNENGSWDTITPLTAVHNNRIISTSLALSRLGYFGFGKEFPPVNKGAEYLYSLQKKDGSWPLSKNENDTTGYSMIPLQTSLPLQGLSLCGYATDSRSEKAYEWLIGHRLDDGAWPTGIASGVFGYVAGYRRIAQSRWGCRSNTTSVLVCLSRHPYRKHSPEAYKALDLLLGRTTKESYCLGYEIIRMLGYETARGFLTFYARNDLSLMLDLCARIGVGKDDERVSDLVNAVEKMKNKNGMWSYASHDKGRTFPETIDAFVTFDIIKSLSAMPDKSSRIGERPVTPFKAYYKKEKRY